jgi:hypothetical protein
MSIEQKTGEYRIIRANGEEFDVNEKPSIAKIQREIGCTCVDTVTLDRTTMAIMVCDDTGMLDNKPINEKATQLARKAFGTQYPYSIHGDVAIVNDEDFA